MFGDFFIMFVMASLCRFNAFEMSDCLWWFANQLIRVLKTLRTEVYLGKARKVCIFFFLSGQ